MSTEQTGRQSIDTTDSIELLVSPSGGDPTPLPQAQAAEGTRKLKAAPPPIPSRTSTPTIPPPVPARASTQTIPPPVPARTAVEVTASAGAKALPAPAHLRAKGTVPPVRLTTADPDGWSVAPSADEPSTATSEPAASSDELRDIMEPDPEGPDATTATPFAEPAAAAPAAAIDAGPSKEWLAKIASVLRPEAAQPPLFTTTAAASMFGTPAEAPQTTQPLELVDLEPVEKAAAPQPAPAVAPPVEDVAPPAPALPPALAQAARAAAPVLPRPAQVVAVAPPPVAAPRAPLATPSGYPVVPPADLDGPTDQDAGSWDINIDSDLTSAHTTNFDLPERQRFITKPMAIAALAGLAVVTVAILAMRGGPATTPAKTATAQAAPATVAPAETPAPAPAPATPAVAQPVAAPAPAQPVAPAQPATPGMIQIPVSSKPAGALVSFVDGGHAVVLGRTPLTINVDPSQPHDIALTLLDHETQLATIPAGGMTALAVDMGPEKPGALDETPKVAAAAPAREETPAKRPVKHPAARHEPKHVTQAAPRAETRAVPSGAGVLMISSKPPCEIVVDGRSTHLTTPQRSIPLAPGTHTVMLVNAHMKIHKSVTVMITSKKSTKVIQDFTKR